jgi:hypothetical protein
MMGCGDEYSVQNNGKNFSPLGGYTQLDKKTEIHDKTLDSKDGDINEYGPSKKPA